MLAALGNEGGVDGHGQGAVEQTVGFKDAAVEASEVEGASVGVPSALGSGRRAAVSVQVGHGGSADEETQGGQEAGDEIAGAWQERASGSESVGRKSWAPVDRGWVSNYPLTMGALPFEITASRLKN